MKAFIITLTGSSMCGKSYVADKIIELQNEFSAEGIIFHPKLVAKYSTRAYREKEVKAIREKGFVDVKSVVEIPKECDIVYLSYGKYYGVSTKELRKLLDAGISPVLVVNDITALHNLKERFRGQLLSLYIFRTMPKLETMIKEGRTRGNTEDGELRDRHEKAANLHMNFLSNVELFDRVVLNVRDYTPDDIKNNNPDLTRIQVGNVLRATIADKISLDRQIKKLNRLFVISGNSQSGKDDVIQGVRRMGHMLSDIVPKYTSRWEKDDDGDEMICQYIPDAEHMKKHNASYRRDITRIEKNYEVGKSKGYPKEFISETTIKYDKRKSTEAITDFMAVQWDVSRLNAIQTLMRPRDRFFIKYNQTAEKDGETAARATFFSKNPKYLDIDEMCAGYEAEIEKQRLIQDEGPTYRISASNQEYIIYENNVKTDRSKFKYAFTIEQLKRPLKKRHVLLVSSLIKTLEYCHESLPDRVIAVFAYSQIEKEKFDESAKTELDKAYGNEYDDLIRYAKNIAVFDHVLIYTESDLVGKSNGLKETLIDQMFKLFRLYR